jgi:predicted Rossmann-fold nucleotide-binding protein
MGTKFWKRAVDFEFLAEEGMIGREDLGLFTVVDDADDAVAALHAFYGGEPPS